MSSNQQSEATEQVIPPQDVMACVVFSKKGGFQILLTEHAQATANDNGDDIQAQRLRAISTILTVPEVLTLVGNIAEEMNIPNVI